MEAGNGEETTFATGLNTLSFSQKIKGDHRVRWTLVVSVVNILSLSCLLGALVFKINGLQEQVKTYLDSCPVLGDQAVAPSLKMEGDILVSPDLADPEADQVSTTTIPTLKFGERPDVVWTRW